MRRILLISAMLLISIAPQMALAHTLERDGSVGAVLHISPNDNPAANQEAVIGFSVSDSARRFAARNCACSVEILQEGKVISSKQLPASLQTRYTFPSTGQYTLRLIGVSKNQSFETFKIDQTIRITSNGSSYVSDPSLRVVSALLLSVLLVGTSILTYTRHQKYAPIVVNHERKKP